ncbi:adenine adenosine cation symporter [Companilactobacillus paralimentarius DSM 13238 = JCM 10415]|uniref:Guanine/hypoxanthine permease PbuO n=3 Tax=Companilactobacillus TaxID=2767879 RepID=A0A202FCH8_9LACO|nr:MULTISPECIES: NCS2 family permease [Companilactobacillus]KAE9557515.1 guanine permease [Companilactobacillus bobalius]KAE9561586.1 guanine permease [Companilactobacillus bobalius]KAE9563662.1 guanine permease [Companilactobacillus bobalius]KAE9565091.1 guanine permease [Companilactobacillus paralimentarius]KRK82485.1 adenine adenosine cation symporter [Companilactobacillus bobalius DSM 19674]
MESSTDSNRSFIEKLFHLQEAQTTVRREILAGLTTFVSMAYILFVNPQVLGVAGMNKGAVFTATALSAILGSILMALLANYPIAIAPGLGDNAFFTYSVVLAMGIPWQTAMAGVFMSSVLFLLISVLKLRELVIDSIPHDLKLAMASGIGLFIAFVGLQGGGLVVGSKSTLVAMGSLTVPTTWLTIFGLVVTGLLMAKKVPGSIFIGMVLTTILGLVTKLIPLPKQVISTIPSMKPTFGVSIAHLPDLSDPKLWAVVLVFLLVAFFDTAGTLIGLAEQAGFMKNNKMPRIGRALMADSISMLGGAVMGTTPTAAYVESSAGIAVGGRTGLTSLVVSIMFAIAMFFSPLLTVVTSNVTAPVLIIVGILMAQSMRQINWNKFEIAMPAFLTIVGMPLTYNISYGFAFGILFYPLTMWAAGRGKEVTPIMYILFFVFVVLLYFINILPG